MTHDRPRRLRGSRAVRALVAETRVHRDDLVQPHFVIADDRAEVAVDALPGIARQGIEPLLRTVEQDLELGIRSALLFGVVDDKDPHGTTGHDLEGPVQRAVRALKQRFGDDLYVITDVCLCTYTDHGHCGVVDASGRVDNDATNDRYVELAVAQAESGAHVVSPSGMMDGQVAAIRDGLDAAGFTDTAILAYAAKFASGFYGPFREAVASSLEGDRRTYQQEPGNAREAVHEVDLDIEEGADLVMVKPAMAYLDIVRAAADISPVPVAAYQVSGEYAMISAAAANGWIDLRTVALESLTGIRRAGADIVLTYWA
ncbi:MAG: porphobilinogen synthase, partial [Planctomycetes bacterium]|nr:porphobilinogen synthase [Planctomycetota bacterium]